MSLIHFHAPHTFDHIAPCQSLFESGLSVKMRTGSDWMMKLYWYVVLLKSKCDHSRLYKVLSHRHSNADWVACLEWVEVSSRQGLSLQGSLLSVWLKCLLLASGNQQVPHYCMYSSTNQILVLSSRIRKERRWCWGKEDEGLQC